MSNKFDHHLLLISLRSHIVISFLFLFELAVLAVSIGVPVLLCYVYAVVPIALCRSDGCGVSAGQNGGVR